ncbi:RagB/SusD family nutrient uptake outer membrane protein [Pedobacter insulae]|uniref:SusD family protein n=1 Tax=Pedobacter insulae TaxID=414048 RepID=A0A1I3A0G5_9SPHI|nr:RagB/SusD family nutrient uptake outer membrane protein [Pedobacter insulae]SFH43380.1 SusD family protein [Pedobacter insulae]
MSTIKKNTLQINKATIACLLCGIALLFSLGGCKKFLEIPLKDKIPQSTLFADEQGFIDALTGVYIGMDKPQSTFSSMKGLYTHNLSIGMLSVMVNNYTNAPTSALGDGLYSNAYKYDYEQTGLKQEIGYIWGGLYHNIANLNNLLNHIDAKKDVFSRDHYNRVKGEALALRALFHFDLARLFGQSPATGLNDRAIPYITTFKAKATPFVSLKAALDSCIVDLKDAKALLAQTDTTAINQAHADLFAGFTQNRMNYWATNACLARIYLYKGDYANAMVSAKEVIGSQKFPLSTSNVAVSTANNRDRLFSKELVFAVYNTNVTIINEGLFNLGGTGVSLQLAAATKTTIYGTTDWRLSWFDNNSAKSFNVPSKFFQDANLPYALQNNVPVIRITEMYYIVSECANALGDLSTGLSYLNMARNARGLTSLTAINVPDGITLSAEIGKEYKKEFIQEGQTYFYYKRLNKDLKAETGTTVTVPANVYVFPIPDKEGENNS